MKALGAIAAAAVALACVAIDNRQLTPVEETTGAGGAPGSGGAGTGGAKADAKADVAAAGGGGSSGSGGTVDARPPCLMPSPLLLDPLDDMEDGNTMLLPSSGRQGYWFAYHETTGTGVQTFPVEQGSPIAALPQARGPSLYGAHFAGSGFQQFAALAFSIAPPIPDGGPGVFDAGPYAGLRLYAMGQGAVRVDIQTTDSQPVAQGGTCITECFGSFGMDFVPGPSWAEHTILFCDLTPRFANPHPFIPAHVMTVNFNVGTAAGPAGIPFDFWIDDVSFVKR